MGFNGANRHWFIIGAEHPVGQCLTQVASQRALPYSSRRLDSREPLSISVGTQSTPLAIIAVVADSPELNNHIRQWLDFIIEQDMPVVLLSSAKVFNYNEVGSLEQDETSGDDGLVELENLVRQQRRHLILRTNQLFSFLSRDFATRLLDQAKQPQPLKLDDLTRIAPTPADDVADVLHAMLQQIGCNESLWGTYHYAGVESTTQYAFAECLLSEAGQYEDLGKFEMLALDDALCHANESVLDSKLIKHTFGIKPKPWRQGLSRLMRRYYRVEGDAG